MNVRSLALIAVVVAMAGCRGGRPSADKPLPPTNETMEQAILSDNVRRVEELLEKGAPVDQPNDNLETPLHIAAKKSRLEIAEALLEHGADVNARTLVGESPLGLNIAHGRGQLFMLLLEHGADPNYTMNGQWSALEFAIGTQKDEYVKLALEKKANPNVVDNGRPAIYTCAMSGTVTAAEMLLKHGADPNARTAQSKETAIFTAVSQGKKMVEVLLKNGADINAKDGKGQTLLDRYLAASRKDPGNLKAKEWIEFLRQHGAK